MAIFVAQCFRVARNSIRRVQKGAAAFSLRYWPGSRTQGAISELKGLDTTSGGVSGETTIFNLRNRAARDSSHYSPNNSNQGHSSRHGFQSSPIVKNRE